MRPRTAISVLLLAALCWTGAMLVSPMARAERTGDDELLYYPSGDFVRESALGFRQAAASFAWLRTVQYYGEHKRGDKIFDMMYHMCDIVTDLDPRFEEPYAFGSWVLFTDAQKPEEGFRLLQKARENNPDSWRVFFESGFAYHVFKRDYETANLHFTKAASLPGAPEYTHRFAAFSAKQAGDLQASFYLYQELAQRTSNPRMREWALEEADRIRGEIAAAAGESAP